jgi:hypothetical protein
MTVGFIYLANVGDDGGGQAAGGGVVEFADMRNWVLSSYSFHGHRAKRGDQPVRPVATTSLPVISRLG